MTDKQIIIDGIDVSGCEHYEDLSCFAYRDSCGYPLDCKDRLNCYYKQLKRAEKTMQEIWDRLGKTSDELLRKEQECEELKRQLETKGKILTLIDEAKNEYLKENQKLKQTLTEIKKIAEKRNYLDYNESLDDILQKISECEVK